MIIIKNIIKYWVLILLIVILILFSINNKPIVYNFKLTRGLIVACSDKGALISFRSLDSDDKNTSFKLYKNNELIHTFKYEDATTYLDKEYSKNDKYYLYVIKNNITVDKYDVELYFNNINSYKSGAYFDIPLDVPISDNDIIYSPNDCVFYDVDGDGLYEVILKWEPSDSKDNSIRGFTSNVYIDCYRLNGEKLWRIDLGKNIRAGASYTQMLVYDYDNDGKGEMILKVADGTIDGLGNIIGKKDIDNRNEEGIIIKGNEYLALFDALDGKVLDVIDYDPKRGNVSSWGDDYGNRSERFLATNAYLDGINPSAVVIRGHYRDIVAVSYNVKNKKLVKKWKFDSRKDKNLNIEGNHQVMPSDVDKDGKDEIVFGSFVLDDDGSLLHNSHLGHGDALHVGEFDLDNDDLEILMCHEEKDVNYGVSLRNARTGDIIHKFDGEFDTGRCLIDNFISSNKGSELVGSHDYLVYDTKGNRIGDFTNDNLIINNDVLEDINFLIYWDGELDRELLNNTHIYKYGEDFMFIGDDVKSINGTKKTPSLSADLFGDWREEVVFPTNDNKKLRIFTTTYETKYKVLSLMQNRQYRMQVNAQNVGYNQPAHLDYYLNN